MGNRGRALKKLRTDISIRFRAIFEMVQSLKELFQNGLNLLWEKVTIRRSSPLSR
jgi:hypothetical protein